MAGFAATLAYWSTFALGVAFLLFILSLVLYLLSPVVGDEKMAHARHEPRTNFYVLWAGLGVIIVGWVLVAYIVAVIFAIIS